MPRMTSSTVLRAAPYRLNLIGNGQADSLQGTWRARQYELARSERAADKREGAPTHLCGILSFERRRQSGLHQHHCRSQTSLHQAHQWHETAIDLRPSTAITAPIGRTCPTQRARRNGNRLEEVRSVTQRRPPLLRLLQRRMTKPCTEGAAMKPTHDWFSTRQTRLRTTMSSAKI